ncbi:hypothetical protein SAMN05660649_04016 [Desulfotomaculum arcticum]|uniref:Uncharacterized protein n=1 Tax=Desulfotruncus arcticus DSM 17038 TaxID=1121424 RepID=A0A1I2XL63_9FIRM|nr:hypothetical protein [Desulfotruncus arcticus]SFH14243.1 hypothetical protein SAMN05660649_04016 [Desulfotomaculum arcticum] [Desulfotruncus arcticus DSM 17038]
MADTRVHLMKNYIIQAVIDTFEQGLGPAGVKVALSKNWHFTVGELIYTDLWEEMDFFTAAELDELIVNLPSLEDVKNGSISLADLKSGRYDWQLVNEFKEIGIIWQ